MRLLICLTAMLALTSAWADNQAILAQIKQINRFTFGSCNKENLPQPYWKHMLKEKPELFLMTGDNIYGDAKDLAELKRKYQKQNSSEGFQKFLETKPIIGVWDDHDFGLNNSNSTTNDKPQRQELFLDFIREPLKTARRQQAGIYTSYEFGKVPYKVKFILLDTRYFKDTLVAGQKDILGIAQWQWLENQLKTSDAQINFIVSSITVVLNETHRKEGEEWSDYPHSKQRLLSLLDKYKPAGVVFLTGDKHYSVYLEEKYNGVTYPEFMSSSLTHGAFPYWLYLYQFSIAKKLYLFPNFGVVSINWQHPKGTQVRFEVKSSYTGGKVRQHDVIF